MRCKPHTLETVKTAVHKHILSVLCKQLLTVVERAQVSPMSDSTTYVILSRPGP